jgi:hypothetical protein
MTTASRINHSIAKFCLYSRQEAVLNSMLRCTIIVT